MAIYNSTNGPSWTNKSGWGGAKGTECSWYGVTCAGVPQSQYGAYDPNQVTVVKINLINNNLSGTLPAISNLTWLEQLELDNNKLTGSIPDISNMRQLAYFSASNNRLTGPLPTPFVPTLWEAFHGQYCSQPVVGDLHNECYPALRWLILNNNQLSGSPQMWRDATSVMDSYSSNLCGNDFAGTENSTWVRVQNPGYVAGGHYLNCQKSHQTVSFGAAPVVSLGGTGTVSASATSGLPVTFSSTTPGVCTVSGNTVTSVASGTCTIAANQEGNASFMPAPEVTQSIIIKASQTLTFGAAPTIVAGGTGTVSATASSGLTASFSSITPGKCTVSGSTVTGVAVGTCTVAANQAGDASYNPAQQITQNITIGVGSQTIDWTTTPTVVVGSAVAATATASSGLPVSYTTTTPGVCTVSGTAITGVVVGNCSIVARQNGNASYTAAPQVQKDIVVGKGNQSITFGTAPAIGTGGTGTVSATTNSSLAVTFSSATPGTCTVSGNTVTGVAYGTCVIAADQAGSLNYNQAPQATQSFLVKYGQTITFGAAPAIVAGSTGTISATATSGQAVSFTSNTPATCTVSGNVVTGISANPCTIAGSQAGTASYAAATATQTITIGVGTQSISWGLAPTVVAGGSGTLSATATSGLPVAFSSTTPATCSVSGTTVSGIAVGVCTVEATQAGNASYIAAVPVQLPISIGIGPQNITFGTAPEIIAGGSGSVSATASSGLPVTFSSTTPEFCTVSGTTVTGVDLGTCTIAANQAGNANYTAAGQVLLSFPVKSTQFLTFTTTPSLAAGKTVPLSATASSGLPVSFSTITPAICSVSGTSVTGIALGTCTVAANQAGNSGYAAAPQITQDITVGIGSQTINFNAPLKIIVGKTGTVSAVATSGLPVSFSSVTPSICTVSGSTVTGVAVGTCTINADQAGSDAYYPAPAVVQSFPIGIVSGMFAYVPNSNSNTVSTYTINQTSGALTAGIAVASGTLPNSVSVDPQNRFAYVTNGSSQTISVYTINQSSGALTAGTTFAPGFTPYSYVAIDPAGKFAYITNHSSSTVSSYSINQTSGALTAATTIATGLYPRSFTFDPLGRFAYVANSGSDTISVYTVNQTSGDLTARTDVTVGSGPWLVTVDPTGRFAYVTIGSTVLSYTINQTTGALTAVGTAVATGLTPTAITVDPTGRFVYVANNQSNTISVYSINQSTGALTTGVAVASGSYPNSVAVDPTGQFAYAANAGSNNISFYTINQITGSLTAGVGAATGSSPSSVAAFAIVVSSPNAPVISNVTAGNAQATVSFTAPSNNGSAITSYTVTAYPGGITATGSASTITVTGLTNGTPYTFSVTATNGIGTSAASAASNEVTPAKDNQILSIAIGLSNSSATGLGGTATIRAYSSSGLPVTLASATPGVCSVNGHIVTAVAAGTCTIAADQSGDAYYNAAPQVTQSFAVDNINKKMVPKFVYVTNASSNCVYVYTINQATGALTAGTFAATGTNPSSVAVDPTGRFAYVANQGSNTVSIYTINQTSGALTAGAAVATGSAPSSVNVDPSGRFVYITNAGSNTISTYSINQSSGALTSGASVVTGSSPYSVIVDPTGRFAYVANYNSNTVSVYTINQSTGALTAGAAIASGTNPWSITIDPTGRFAYVANRSSDTVSVYTINQTSGALTAGTAIATGTGPYSVAVDPSGRFAYVANAGPNTVSAYTINQSTGALTAAADVATGAVPVAVTVDPTGSFTYAVNSSSRTVSAYTIDQNTGALTAGDVVAADIGPNAIAVSSGILRAPNAPTIGSATAGNAQATVSFTAPADNGGSAITGYTVTSTPDGITATGSASPITVTGLTNGTPYTFTVTATNGIGVGTASAASNAVTPLKDNQALNLTIGLTNASVTGIGGTATALTYASSGLPVSLTSATPGVCTVNGLTVTAIAAGTCTVAADQPGNAYYNAAPQVTQSFTVDNVNKRTAPKFVYVANYFSNTVSAYTINQTTGALTTGTAAATGTNPNSVTVDPTGRFAYVANRTSNTVSVYTINQTTGVLTTGTAVATGSGPFSVTVDPSGRFAYVANRTSNTVSVYTINQSNGALTAGTAVATGSSPSSVIVDPTGRFAYVTNSSSNTVSVYAINQSSGALTAGTAVAAGTNPYSVAVDPSGRFAYVANYGSNTVSVYTINQTSGALTAGTAVAATGTYPFSVFVEPSGRAAYVANYGSSTISIYTIDQSSGALSAATTVMTGDTPYSVTVDPTGRFAYVANYGSSTVSNYTIDQASGALNTGTAVATGNNPMSVAVSAGVVTTPSAPAIGVATAGFQQATVSFVAPTDNGGSAITGYTVTSNPEGITATGVSSPITVTGLTNGQSYTFTVTATNSVLTSPASADSNTVVPSKAEQTLTVVMGASFAPATVAGGAAPVFTYSSSGLPVSLTSNTPDVCTVAGNIVTAVKAGTCAIDVNQAGNDYYNAAVRVRRVFTIGMTSPGIASKFAYVANSSSNTVSVYTINPSNGAMTAGTAVATGSLPYSVIVDPTGRFAYVANYGSNTVSVYTINQNTGALTAGTAVASGSNPRSITVDPTGRYAYVANLGSNTVSVYTINQTTGALTAGAEVATGTTPYSVAVDPSGRFAYVANAYSSTVSVYTINQATGALTAGNAVATESGPYSVAVDPAGRFAYAANYGSNTVSVYTINQDSGALTVGTAAPTGTSPRSVAIDPTGRFAYAVNSSSNTVSVYTIDQATGALNAGNAVATGSSPYSVSVDPAGRFAYVANAGSSTVSVYTINQATGALTAENAVTTGSGPYSVAVSTVMASPPGAPTISSVTAGSAQATVTFTAPADNGSPITGYTLLSYPGGVTATGSTSPITVTGLTNGTSYTFTVVATNGIGFGAESAPSSSVTPSKYDQTITFAKASSFSPATVVGGSALIQASASSGLLVSFTAITPAVCTVTGSTVTAVAAGICTIAADQVGNSDYNAAPQITHSFTVGMTSRSIDAKFAYTANFSSNTVSVYTINPATGTLTAGTTVAAGTGPMSVTVDPTGRFAYVANQNSNTVSVYTINQTNGALIAGTAVSTGTAPRSVAVDPTGRFAYVANYGPNTVSVYTINQVTGALTAGTTAATGTRPYSVAVDPTGRFAYVANYDSNSISVFTINQTSGALTAGTAVGNGGSPCFVTVDPTGRFVYVANYMNGSISAYSINQTTGALTAVATIAAGNYPYSVAIDPTGRFVYVANSSSTTVSVYTINQTTGALTAGTPVTTGVSSNFVTVDPTGRFVYVVTNSVSVYTINQTTGALTAGTVVATGTSPYSIAVSLGTFTSPGAPTISNVTAGVAQATINFTAPADNGGSAITGYTVIASPGGITATGTASPITVTGLTNGTPYTFTVFATNGIGVGAASAISNEVIPSKLSQTISMGTIPALVIGSSGTVSASATSGLAVSFSTLTPAICSVTGSTVTAVAAGTCTIAANQDGNSTYNAAPQVTGSGTVNITVTGTVSDLSTGSKLSGATATISGGGSVQTDANGNFIFTVLPINNPYSITISKSGYKTITIAGLVFTSSGNFTLRTGLVPASSEPLNFSALPTLPPASTGTAYNQPLTITSGSGPYTFNLAYNALPAGLQLDSATGAINGTPTVLGSYTFGIGVTDSLGSYAEREFTIHVTPPLSISTVTLPRGMTSAAYSAPVTATGGAPAYTFSLLSGTLPAGLTLDSTLGLIKGNITGAPGTFNVTIKVIDSEGRSVLQSYTLNVDPLLTQATAQMKDAIVGTPYSQALTVAGGLAPYTWSIYSGRMIAGLALDPATGSISGTPAVSTSEPLTIVATDSAGRPAYQTYTLRSLDPLQIPTTSLPNGFLAVPAASYSEQIRVTGGIAPYSFSISGQLPAGLNIDTTTGIISGFPTVGGLTNVNITATDSTWPTAQSKTVTMGIRVWSQLTITTTSIFPNARKGVAITPLTLAARGGTTPYSWSVVANKDGSTSYLPQGLTLDPVLGVVSGTPADVGEFTFTIRVTDSSGTPLTVDKQFYMRVSDTLSVATDIVPTGAINTSFSTTLLAKGGLKNFSWIVKSGTLPSGLSLNGSTGVISGTPLVKTGSPLPVVFEVNDSDTPPQAAQKTLVFEVYDTLAISEGVLPHARQGEAYTANIRPLLGTAPYVWSVAVGSLPPGLSLQQNSGIAALQGTPTHPGTYTFTLAVHDSSSLMQQASRQFTVEVYSPVFVSNTSLRNAMRGVAYNDAVAVTGGVAPYHWQIVSGNIPQGLIFNSMTGGISGVTDAAIGFTAGFTVRVTDGGTPAASVEQQYTIQAIDPLVITTTGIPSALQYAPFSVTFSGLGGISPHVWVITSGSLPNEIVLNAATGVLAGTPVTCGSFPFTIGLADNSAVPETAQASFVLSVSCNTSGPNPLSVTLTGTGKGSVNSSPSGINCLAGTCTAIFTPDKTVSLYQAASNGSQFVAWSGACTGSGTCSLPMTAAQNVTATFDIIPNVMIQNGALFGLLQDAYDVAASNSTILAKSVTLIGNLNINSAKTVNIIGGYDSVFAAQNGITAIRGTLTISDGTLVVDKISIE